GNYSVNLFSNGLASGVYFYRLTTSSFSDIKKIMVLK
ncbi:MAG: T9SS type A sorting domain-containing protein, partial [Melioribacteraceae bacterium]|nr:T9SS type A sorting domain-containing protein [Melioribacteraceae bacterium]